MRTSTTNFVGFTPVGAANLSSPAPAFPVMRVPLPVEILDEGFDGFDPEIRFKLKTIAGVSAFSLLSDNPGDFYNRDEEEM